MKVCRTTTVLVITLFAAMLQSNGLLAQSPYNWYEYYSQANQGVLRGGLGYSEINDVSYLMLNVRPDLAFGKWGVGLDVTLRFNTDTGEIRKEDWDQPYDYFRKIMYIRYGNKLNPDPVYARLGVLTAARLGHGFIMNYYNSGIVLDERKLGLAFDYDFGMGGFETMTSNLGRAEIFGGRLFYRPLQLATDAPIIKNLTFGASYVTDIDPDGSRATDNAVSSFGFDVELPIVKTAITSLKLYGDVAKIIDYGSGQALGIDLRLTGLSSGILDLGMQLERRFIDPMFLPGYFDAFYEIERGDSTKIKRLIAQTQNTRGTFGVLYGQILNSLQLLGSYERLDGTVDGGRLHIEATIPETIPRLAVRGSYDDRNIDTFSDVFKLDENSSAHLGIGYKFVPFMLVGVNYIWTFQYDQTLGRYVVQKRFEPQLSFSYEFPVGGGG